MAALRSIAAAMCVLVLLSCAGPAAAASKDEKKRVSYTVSQYTFKKLEKAHALLAEEKYTESRQVLDQMAGRKGLNLHEQALLYQTYGFIESSQERYREAAASFEKCLALDALPLGAQLNTRYNLAQLYLADERFDKAAENLEAWFARAENPAASAYYLLAIAYVQSDRPDKALAPARTAVEKAKVPKEPWLQLLLALYLDQKNYGKAVGLLERLVKGFPKKTYWLQLSAVYAELGREDDSAAVMQIAHTQGMLEKDGELRNLARMYLYQDIPYRAARVLEKGIADKKIKEDAKAWELLADSWLNAREYDRALPPLRRAATLSEKGDLYVRLARLHVEAERWGQAAAALRKGLAKKTLKDRGKALILLGISYHSDEHWDDARKAFNQAKDFPAQRKEAERWLTHLERRARMSEQG